MSRLRTTYPAHRTTSRSDDHLPEMSLPPGMPDRSSGTNVGATIDDPRHHGPRGGIRPGLHVGVGILGATCGLADPQRRLGGGVADQLDAGRPEAHRPTPDTTATVRSAGVGRLLGGVCRIPVEFLVCVGCRLHVAFGLAGRLLARGTSRRGTRAACDCGGGDLVAPDLQPEMASGAELDRSARAMPGDLLACGGIGRPCTSRVLQMRAPTQRAVGGRPRGLAGESLDDRLIPALLVRAMERIAVDRDDSSSVTPVLEVRMGTELLLIVFSPRQADETLDTDCLPNWAWEFGRARLRPSSPLEPPTLALRAPSPP